MWTDGYRELGWCLFSSLSYVVLTMPPLLSEKAKLRSKTFSPPETLVLELTVHTQCRACKTKTSCSQLFIPYAAKLLFQVCRNPNEIDIIPSIPIPLSGTPKHEHRCTSIHNIFGSYTRLISVALAFAYLANTMTVNVLYWKFIILLRKNENDG
jgi:hypothetical protein